MSDIPVWGNLEIKGDVTSDSSRYLTGDTRPVAPAVQNVSGSYTLDSFNASVYRSAEYLVQITQGSNFSVVRLMVLHNNVSAFISEYGRIETSETNVDFSVSLVNSVVTISYTQPDLITVVKALGNCLNP